MMIQDLNARARDIMRLIVESYVETGSPVGSRILSYRLGGISPATIRSVMADLEASGLLYAPHISAGRLPTEAGLRMFVDGLLEVGNLSRTERETIANKCQAFDQSMTGLMEEAGVLMSGLSGCAGIVTVSKQDVALKDIEFVMLSPGRVLVVLVSSDGQIQNRMMALPANIPASALVSAGNYLSTHMTGRTLSEAVSEIRKDMQSRQSQLDQLTQKVVEAGLASWSDPEDKDAMLIIKGQANLLEDVQALADLEHIRALFQVLEEKKTMIHLLELAQNGEGVQIFIGAENKLFALSGCSMIVAPYKNEDRKIVGIIGIVGPTRMNYSRIVPMVDYTASVVGRLISRVSE